MTIFSGVGGGQIVNNAVQLCKNLRDTLEGFQNLQEYLSAQTNTDLESTGISASDLTFIQDAVADGNAVASFVFTGQPPNTYPQASTAYTYINSMRELIGPQ